MSTTSTDPREIEEGLERDRASLASTLDALSDRVSVDHLAREALGAIKSHAGTYTSTIDTAVRANPLATALIGAGVAWLLLGNRLGGGRAQETPATGHPTHDELPRWEGEGGPPPEYGAIAYRPTTDAGDDEGAWSRDVSGLRARASAALRRIEADARAYVGGAVNAAGQARDYATERASVVSGFAADLSARFAHGLDGLSDSSRERVVAARERAYAAGLKAERAGRAAVAEPARLLEDHPLVSGAVAFALGAAVAAALPRTDVEDRTFGADRDRLMDEATRLLRAERTRAMQIAGSLTDEVKAAALETLEAATDKASQAAGSLTEGVKAAARETFEAAADKASQAAGRVADRASEEVAATRPAKETGGPVTA